jgi:hypothetical protein
VGKFIGFGGSQLTNMGDVFFNASSVDTNGDSLTDVSGVFKESGGIKSKIVATGEYTITNIGTLTFLDVNADGRCPFRSQT